MWVMLETWGRMTMTQLPITSTHAHPCWCAYCWHSHTYGHINSILNTSVTMTKLQQLLTDNTDFNRYTSPHNCFGLPIRSDKMKHVGWSNDLLFVIMDSICALGTKSNFSRCHITFSQARRVVDFPPRERRMRSEPPVNMFTHTRDTQYHFFYIRS
jgi:hypothetical protein